MVKIVFFLLCLIPLAWSSKVNANYFTMKSFLLYLVGGLSFLTLAFRKSNSLRFPQAPWKWWAAFFIFVQILYAFIFGFPLGLLALPKFISLFGVILFLSVIEFDLNSFFKKYDWVVLAFFGLLLVLTSRDLVPQLINSNFKIEAGLIIHPFGNVNMLAEFYLLCVPLLYYWIQQKNEILKIVKVGIFVLVHVVLMATKSRSVYFGLALWWVLWVYQSYFEQRKKLFFIGLMICTVTLATVIYKTGFSLDPGKSYSTSERLNYYKSAKDLILDHPFGVGNQYATKIIPYRLQYSSGPMEHEYPDQPHSEILKWGVQFGWLGFVMSLGLLGLVIFQVTFKGSFLLKGAAFALLPQLLFQFPFENPATIMMLAIYIFLFAQSLPQDSIPLKKIPKLISGIMGFVLILFSCLYLTSIYLESNYPQNLAKTTDACHLNPSNSRACIRKNYNLLQEHQYADLKKSLAENMRLNYYAADYLKILSDGVSEGSLEPELVIQDESRTSVSVYGSVDHQSRNIEKTCQIQHVYVFIYKNQQHYSVDEAKACLGVAAPFDFNLPPLEFDRAYKNWLTNLLK